jgi:hypothetical protein
MDSDRIVVGAIGDDHQYADPNDEYNSAAPTRMPTSMPTGTPTSATGAPTASSSVLPYPCDWNTPPLQMIARNADKQWDIKILDIETGSYVQQYAVGAAVDLEEIGSINGASISPNDNKVPQWVWEQLVQQWVWEQLVQQWVWEQLVQQWVCLSLRLEWQVYASVWIDGTSLGHIVRFDNATFEYVAQVHYSYAATFDRVNGDFFYVEQASRTLC